MVWLFFSRTPPEAFPNKEGDSVGGQGFVWDVYVTKYERVHSQKGFKNNPYSTSI
jgi:hypothetical protein